MALVDYVKSDPTPDTVAKMIREASGYQNCGITMTQIRAIFGAIRRLDASLGVEKSIAEGELPATVSTELRMMEARIHYRIERFLQNPGKKKDEVDFDKVKLLSEQLIEALSAVQKDRDKFKRFIEAFEAVVAYMPRK